MGASENLRESGGYQMGYGIAWPSSYPVAPIRYDLASNNSNGMAAFSGRGPTDDGRVKPDICAPGTNIVSCRSQNYSPVGWGVYNSHYIYWGGTSMSTPQVAGAAALVREYYQKEKQTNASAALVKAVLIHGAADMSPGQYGTGRYRELTPVPDYSQGWGRLNLANSLFPDPPTAIESADETPTISTGAFREYQYNVIDNTVPFNATLVWTDYPGSVLAQKELVNDLDLTVTSPTDVEYPIGGPTDRTNNVEQIAVAQPELGVYRVRVTGYDVPMGPQDYALVVSGGLPSTYISGTVTSVSGAAVQGALITLVSAGQVKRVTTNSSGKFFTRVAPDAYSVQIAKPGWTFAPRSRIVTVTGSPVENVDFTGTGAPGSVSGTISGAIGGVVSHIVESPHPYLNNFDRTRTITAHEQATRVRVHFAEIDLMDDGDTVYVLDGEDNTVNTFNGRGEDIWSSWVTGNTVKIRLTSDSFGNIGYGFYIDGYETDLIQHGGTGGTLVKLSPGGYESAAHEDGTYTVSGVPPGVYAVSATKPHWKFQPASLSVDVPAGSAAHGADFLAFPPGSVDGEIRVAESEVRSVNVQSEHPYQDNYENTWTVDSGRPANRIRLHFGKIDTEPAWDFVYIIDSEGNVIEAYTALVEDLWTPWMSGGVAQIMLSTDSGGDPYWGFKCDRYELETLGAGLASVQCALSPDGVSRESDDQGAFGFPEVDVGDHSVTPALDVWTFDPAESLVSVAAGLNTRLLFYAKVAELAEPNLAKRVPDGIVVSLKGVVVTATFNGFFYAQQSERTGGIRIDWPNPVTEGMTVDITGRMSTLAGERLLIATAVTPH